MVDYHKALKRLILKRLGTTGAYAKVKVTDIWHFYRIHETNQTITYKQKNKKEKLMSWLITKAGYIPDFYETKSKTGRIRKTLKIKGIDVKGYKKKKKRKRAKRADHLGIKKKKRVARKSIELGPVRRSRLSGKFNDLIDTSNLEDKSFNQMLDILDKARPIRIPPPRERGKPRISKRLKVGKRKRIKLKRKPINIKPVSFNFPEEIQPAPIRNLLADFEAVADPPITFDFSMVDAANKRGYIKPKFDFSMVEPSRIGTLSLKDMNDFKKGWEKAQPKKIEFDFSMVPKPRKKGKVLYKPKHLKRRKIPIGFDFSMVPPTPPPPRTWPKFDFSMVPPKFDFSMIPKPGQLSLKGLKQFARAENRKRAKQKKKQYPRKNLLSAFSNVAGTKEDKDYLKILKMYGSGKIPRKLMKRFAVHRLLKRHGRKGKRKLSLPRHVIHRLMHDRVRLKRTRRPPRYRRRMPRNKYIRKAMARFRKR